MIAKISTPIKPLTVFKIISFISSAPVAKIYCKISITIGIKTKNEIFLYLLYFDIALLYHLLNIFIFIIVPCKIANEKTHRYKCGEI